MNAEDLPMNGRSTKAIAAAALVPEMAVQALRLHQVEIAAADFAAPGSRR